VLGTEDKAARGDTVRNGCDGSAGTRHCGVVRSGMTPGALALEIDTGCGLGRFKPGGLVLFPVGGPT
jgi:hypothetical protein